MPWSAPKVDHAVKGVVTSAQMNTIGSDLAYLHGGDNDVDTPMSSPGITPWSVTNANSGGQSAIYVNNDIGRARNAGLTRIGSAGSAYAGANSLNLGTFLSDALGLLTNNALRLIITAAGKIGLIDTNPQLTVQLGDGNAHAGIWSSNTVGGTSQTVLPAGSVQTGAHICFMCLPTSGSTLVNNTAGGVVFAPVNSGGRTLWADASPTATEQCQLTINSNGSVTVQRSLGSLTYYVAIWILWR